MGGLQNQTFCFGSIANQSAPFSLSGSPASSLRPGTMDKLPAGIRNKFLKKQAAKAAESASTSGTTTPSTGSILSGAETPLTPTTQDPEIPFPLSDLDACLACDTPCTPEEVASYPAYIAKSIDRELPLLGSVKPYGRHILVATGKTDWMHSIDEEEGSVTRGIWRGLYDKDVGGRKRDGEERIVLSNTSFAPRRIGSRKTEVVLLPDFRIIGGV